MMGYVERYSGFYRSNSAQDRLRPSLGVARNRLTGTSDATAAGRHALGRELRFRVTRSGGHIRVTQ